MCDSVSLAVVLVVVELAEGLDVVGESTVSWAGSDRTCSGR